MPFPPIPLINFITHSSLFNKYPYTLYNSTFSFFAMEPLIAKIICDFLPFDIISCAFGQIDCYKLEGSMAPTCRAMDYHLLSLHFAKTVHILYDMGIDIFFLQISRIPDRMSTRLNSSHLGISYAVF